ncbi:hypothetical protein [Streptomyces sp. NPDC046887]|uniref:hypothetical protein n=1 Tax=Streptomyces sp. NPDC046887 TaxID=3155472 RepID=UPI00340A4CBD
MSKRISTRRDSRRFVRDLGLPPADSIRDLLPHVEKRSGHPIRVVPNPLGGTQGVCGVWIRTGAGVDYIFVDEKTSRAHQDHIIAHELAHILCDHHGALTPAPAVVMTDQLITTLAPETVRTMLGRSDYTYQDEREAELIGSHLQRHVHGPGRQVGAHDRVAETLLRTRR